MENPGEIRINSGNPMLTQKEISRIVDFIEVLGEGEKGGSAFFRLCRELQPLLVFSSAGFIPFDKTTRTIQATGYQAYNCNEQLFLQYILHYSSEDPFISTGWYLDTRSNVALLSDFVRESRLIESPFAKDFLSQIPMLYCMRIKIFHQGDFLGLLSLHRTTELGDYSYHEVAIAEVLAPYLGRFIGSVPLGGEPDLFSGSDHGVVIISGQDQILYANDIGKVVFQLVEREIQHEMIKNRNTSFLQTPNGPYRLKSFPLTLFAVDPLPEGIMNCRRKRSSESIRVLFLEPLSPSPVFRKKGALKLLSPKQQEVALKVMQGHSNRRIAEILGITEQTVKDHLHTIFEKLRLKNRWELIVFLGGKTGAENPPANDRNR